MKYKKSIEEISKSSGSDTISCVTMVSLIGTLS